MSKRAIRIVSVIICLISLVILGVVTFSMLKAYENPADFKDFIDGFGGWGFFMMLFVQISQIVVAIIPGELVEFVAGTVYGWWGGMLFCLFGVSLGQALIFKMVRQFGSDFAEKIAGSKVMTRFKFLQDEKKLKNILFLMFFIPGTPKDLLTYIVPLTKIKMKDFIVITLFARIPSIVSSTYAGDAFADKNITTMIIVYGVIIAVSLCGTFLYKQWEIRHEKKLTEKAQTVEN